MAATAKARPAPTNFWAFAVGLAAAPVKLMIGATGDVLDGITVYDGLISLVIGAGVVGTGTTVECSALDQSPHPWEDDAGTGTIGVVVGTWTLFQSAHTELDTATGVVLDDGAQSCQWLETMAGVVVGMALEELQSCQCWVLVTTTGVVVGMALEELQSCH